MKIHIDLKKIYALSEVPRLLGLTSALDPPYKNLHRRGASALEEEALDVVMTANTSNNSAPPCGDPETGIVKPSSSSEPSDSFFDEAIFGSQEECVPADLDMETKVREKW